MQEIFGGLERLATSHLYPYRVPITFGLVIALAALAVAAYRAGMHRAIGRHRLAAALVAVPLLAVMLPAGHYTLAPLWRRAYLEEASPLATIAHEVSLAPASATHQAGVEPDPAPVTAASAAAAPAPQPNAAPAAVAPAPPSTVALMAAAPTPPPAPAPIATVAAPPTAPTSAATMPFVPHVARAGQFRGADDFHFGRGQVQLIETAPGRFTLRFEGFSVRNGPDLFVYLSPSTTGYADGGLNLGRLKATNGDFNYEVPAGTDITQFQSVVVWCRRFATLFATAALS